jgi:hypothetical protein
MTISVRDRFADLAPHFLYYETDRWGRPQVDVADLTAIPAGDILRGQPSGAGWQVEPRTEHFKDDVDRTHPLGVEMGIGGLAELLRTGQVAAGMRLSRAPVGAVWFDANTGNPVAHEAVCDPLVLEPYRPAPWPWVRPASADNEGTRGFYRAPGTLGDMELLCGPDAAPTPTVTRPPETPSPTATETPVATAVAPTGTPSAATRTPTDTPAPLVPVYLPLLNGGHVDQHD